MLSSPQKAWLPFDIPSAAWIKEPTFFLVGWRKGPHPRKPLLDWWLRNGRVSLRSWSMQLGALCARLAGFEPPWGLPKCGNSWTGNPTSRCFSHDLVRLNGTNFMFHVFSQILLGYAGFLYVTTDPPKKKLTFFYICRHLKLLAHVISGLRPSLEDIAEAVECFLYHSRPRGKSLPTGF